MEHSATSLSVDQVTGNIVFNYHCFCTNPRITSRKACKHHISEGLLYDIFNCLFIGVIWLNENILNGMQYAGSESRVSWFNASESCHQDDATLAVVTSSEQDDFLWQRFISTSTE